MVPGRDLRHHATVYRMQINLAVQRLPDQAPFGVEKRHPGLVATRFQPQYQHRRRIIPQGL